MASYAPIFVLDIDEAVNSGQSATIQGFGQSFQLVNVMLSGSDGCVATVKNGGNTAAVAYVVGTASGQADSTTRITNANCTFASTATITVQVTGANATRIQLLCRAVTGLARSITVSVA